MTTENHKPARLGRERRHVYANPGFQLIHAVDARPGMIVFELNREDDGSPIGHPRDGWLSAHRVDEGVDYCGSCGRARSCEQRRLELAPPLPGGEFIGFTHDIADLADGSELIWVLAPDAAEPHHGNPTEVAIRAALKG